MDQQAAAASSAEPAPAVPSTTTSPPVSVSARHHRKHGKRDHKHHDLPRTPEPVQDEPDGAHKELSLGSSGPLPSSEPQQVHQEAPGVSSQNEPHAPATVPEPVEVQRKEQGQPVPSQEKDHVTPSQEKDQGAPSLEKAQGAPNQKDQGSPSQEKDQGAPSQEKDQVVPSQEQEQVVPSQEPCPPNDVPDPVVTQYLPLAMALVALVLIVTLELVFAGPLSYPQRPPNAVLVPSDCTTELCARYVERFKEAMNTNAPPCDNFYAYACGSWDSSHPWNGRNSVIAESWGQLARRAASRLSMVPDPIGKMEPVHRASLFIYTCLAIIRVPRVPEIDELLAKGNITWPKSNDDADFLGALFYMARQLFLPMAFDVGTLETVGPEKSPSSRYLTLYFVQSRRFQEHVRALASLRRSGQLLDHLRLMYETLAGSVNESRLKELASHYDYLDDFFHDYQKVGDYVTRSDDASFFLQYTPSVPKDRWDAMMRRYLDIALFQDGGDGNMLRGGVVIQDADLFATFFEIHAKHGEFFANDVVGAMCVQTLAEFASFDILASLFRSRTVATQRIYESCFSNAYMFYGYAIDAYFHQPLSREVMDLRLIAAVVHESFPDMRRRRRMMSATNTSLNNTSSRYGHFDSALSSLDKLNLKRFAANYDRYPNMTDSPVYDWIQHAAFAYAGGLVATEGPVPLAAFGDIRRAAGTFKNFRLFLAHMEEPFYAANVSAAVLMAGIGTRLAAALFYDLVGVRNGTNRSGDSANVYAENHECLSPGTGIGSFLDLEFQAAVASVGLAWTALRRVQAGTHVTPHGDRRRFAPGGIGPLKQDELFFIFFCYLFCGDVDGERMCNVPLQHSAEFSRVFACANASFMNPLKKCRMIR